jgi:hypothetical protein
MKITSRRKRVLVFAAALTIAGLSWAAVKLLPLGLTGVEHYFAPVGERSLQPDEIGQLRSTMDEYKLLANTADEFQHWNEERRQFWKYTIAFSSYGLPSAMIIDPENHGSLKVLMDTMIWKMKSRKVWGDFTEWGFGVDPISYQNIMYKGHLNLMYGLYQLTTGDTRYAREYTWLTGQIVKEMQLHHQGHYEGTTCEPNHWFVECNIIGLMSLHLYDRLFGTNYTDNEVQWTLDFIFERMRDPQTGLFYRLYQPNHDVVDKRLLGYPNAWNLTFLHVLKPELAEELYPVWKASFVTEFGPYATVDGELGGVADPIAHIFGLWAAKEFRDIELYGKLRNTTDHFAKLRRDPATGAMIYQGPDGMILNGVVLATKFHLGWNTVLDKDWGHPTPYPIPDISGMDWTDLIPSRIYTLDPDAPLPQGSDKRPCPLCYWGDYNPPGIDENLDAANETL